MAQSTDPAEGLPLDDLLNTRISTASKYEQRVTDVPASVTVITAEEIARNGWHTLADALASVAGVNLTYDRGYTYLGARGVGLPKDYNNRFLILLNGQPMTDGVLSAIDVGTALGVDLGARLEDRVRARSGLRAVRLRRDVRCHQPRAQERRGSLLDHARSRQPPEGHRQRPVRP